MEVSEVARRSISKELKEPEIIAAVNSRSPPISSPLLARVEPRKISGMKFMKKYSIATLSNP
jgi:hypothetical protein